VLKQYVCLYHFENGLKALESTKNYLQLGKLSEDSLNYLLAEYLRMQGETAEPVINHILENYFNRKSLRPADYFLPPALAPLRAIWEKYHHKLTLRAPRPDPTPSLAATQRREADTPTKMHKLNSLCLAASTLGTDNGLFKSENIQDDALLDLRLQSLAKELEQKSRKAACL
jgi:hypothetical protein